MTDILEAVHYPSWMDSVDRVKMARMNVQFAREWTRQPPSQYRALIDLRHEELDAALDAWQAGTRP